MCFYSQRSLFRLQLRITLFYFWCWSAQSLQMAAKLQLKKCPTPIKASFMYTGYLIQKTVISNTSSSLKYTFSHNKWLFDSQLFTIITLNFLQSNYLERTWIKQNVTPHKITISILIFHGFIDQFLIFLRPCQQPSTRAQLYPSFFLICCITV